MNLQDVANPQTGTRDTLRHGLKSGNGDAGTVHALQSRLEQVSPLFLFLFDYVLREGCLIKRFHHLLHPGSLSSFDLAPRYDTSHIITASSTIAIAHRQ